MRFYRALHHVPVDSQGCVATIGNFDGVHQGHRQVFTHLQAQARRMGLAATVISFEPLPVEFFARHTTQRIYPLRDKIRQLAAAGIERFIVLPFNADFAAIDAEDFVQQILLKHLKVRYLAVGDDFRFGRKRQGDFALLKRLGEPQGMQVQDTPTYEYKTQRISSTRVRTALAKGDLITAQQLLGHPYQLSGRVRHGDKLGRTIGFPTLNMRLPDNLALRKGIYAVRIHGLNGLTEKIYYGAASLGTRPTVSGRDMRLETHVFDFSGDAYGQYVCIELVKFIRDEEKFDNVAIMQAHIQQDCQHIQQFFAQNSTY
ncbi:MAG TPA: bifunctional riboflavin kinase/FAD synthetase [Thiothrix sp.]|nr:bifunctional riboflavin kinase/FAD synthetase [Thiothrix sp.]